MVFLAASCKNAFNAASEISGCVQWDYVFNCAAETRPGQSEAVYNEGVYKLSLNCAIESATHNVKRYIEFSSGNMCSSDQPINEDCTMKPWTFVAQNKAKVEEELRNLGLNYTILRLPVVYGKGDRRGLSKYCFVTWPIPISVFSFPLMFIDTYIFTYFLAPRIVIAALYKHLGEPMKLLWNDSMKMSTVHISDVVAAAFELATNDIANKQCYNIVDDSESTQGSLSNILADLFKIKVDYWGVLMSSITKVEFE